MKMWDDYLDRQFRKHALITAVRKGMNPKPRKDYERTTSLIIGWFFAYALPCLIVLMIYKGFVE